LDNIRAYGGKNIMENVATMVETIKSNPSQFKEIMEDPFEVYKQKVRLLFQYGFINIDQQRKH
jgi:hypothetical protein